jgi:hypothetical protein
LKQIPGDHHITRLCPARRFFIRSRIPIQNAGGHIAEITTAISDAQERIANCNHPMFEYNDIVLVSRFPAFREPVGVPQV